MRIDYPSTLPNAMKAMIGLGRGWNRLAVVLRSPVGDYVSPHAVQAA